MADDKVERLKELISNYWHLDGEGLDWDTEFSSRGLKNFSSLRTLRFLASIEAELGVSIEDPGGIKSFRDLMRLVED